MNALLRPFLQWLIAVAAALALTLPLGFLAGYWESFGYVLLTIAPFTIGFIFGHILPLRTLFSPVVVGTSAVLLALLLLLFYVALGVAGLLCALVGILMFLLPFVVGTVTVAVLRYVRKRG